MQGTVTLKLWWTWQKDSLTFFKLIDSSSLCSLAVFTCLCPQHVYHHFFFTWSMLTLRLSLQRFVISFCVSSTIFGPATPPLHLNRDSLEQRPVGSVEVPAALQGIKKLWPRTGPSCWWIAVAGAKSLMTLGPVGESSGYTCASELVPVPALWSCGQLAYSGHIATFSFF